MVRSISEPEAKERMESAMKKAGSMLSKNPKKIANLVEAAFLAMLREPGPEAWMEAKPILVEVRIPKEAQAVMAALATMEGLPVASFETEFVSRCVFSQVGNHEKIKLLEEIPEEEMDVVATLMVGLQTTIDNQKGR